MSAIQGARRRAPFLFARGNDVRRNAQLGGMYGGWFTPTEAAGIGAMGGFLFAVARLGFDPVWFGILIVCVLEIGMISPPVDMNVFVLRSVLPDVPTAQIWRGVMPFLYADILRLSLLISFPMITLWLSRFLGL